MGHVVYLRDAIDDLHQIWSYVALQSQEFDRADRVIDSIDEAASLYGRQPELGEARPELAPNLRCFSIGRYAVFYVPTPAGIEVIQVIHGSRDIPSHFRRPRGEH